jgi:glycosyltransferase involved in cell wall biosynthesis
MNAFYYLVPAETRHRIFHESWGRYLRRLLFRPRERYPTGGVQIIYRHVGLLRRLGFEAQVVHLGDFRVDWFEHGIDPIRLNEARARIRPEDVLVVPERLPRRAGELRCRRKLAFVQNWGLVERSVGSGDYADFGFTGVLCCGDWLSAWMSSRTRLPVWRVGNGIDLTQFAPDPARRQANRVLYLRRKPTWVLGEQALRRIPQRLTKTVHPVALPHDRTQDEVAAAYREADVFLALGFPEGFALPPLEAMACGCAVVGFAGGGGLDFMEHGVTALVAPDGDVAALARALERVLSDAALKERIRRSGTERARGFGLDRMEDELVRFAESIAA